MMMVTHGSGALWGLDVAWGVGHRSGFATQLGLLDFLGCVWGMVDGRGVGMCGGCLGGVGERWGGIRGFWEGGVDLRAWECNVGGCCVQRENRIRWGGDCASWYWGWVWEW